MKAYIFLFSLIALTCCGDEKGENVLYYEGGTLYPLFEELGSKDPAYSSDGKQILFIKGGDIWTISTSTWQVTKRTSISGAIKSPNWDQTPGSKRVCFVFIYQNQQRLMIMTLDEEPIEIYRSPNTLDFSSWSYSGDYIIFLEKEKQNGIFRIPISGGDPELINNIEGWEMISYCESSHSSDTVIFPQVRDGSNCICRISIDAGIPEVIGTCPMYIRDVCDSFDGNFLAMTTVSGEALPRTDLWLAAIGGQAKRAMRTEIGGDVYGIASSPSWSPTRDDVVVEISNRLYRLEITPGFLD
jgi:Tol biopolymer transport system component